MDHDTENEGKTVFIDVDKHWSTILKKGIDQLTNAQIGEVKSACEKFDCVRGR